MSADRPREVNDAITVVSVFAAAANVIMQLSQPAVGHGVVESPVESGSVVKHPFKRARTTFTYLAVALWGSDEDKATYRTAVNTSHRQVRSTENSPVEYNAFDRDLQLWVAACLYHGLEDVLRAMYPDNDFRGDHGIYEASHTVGTTLQVRREDWPDDRDAYEIYWKEGLERASIDDTVREYLMQLVDLTVLPGPVRRVVVPHHRFLTIGFLPPELRDQMRLEWTEADQQRFDKVMHRMGVVNRLLPGPVRRLPYNLYLADFRLRVRLGMKLV